MSKHKLRPCKVSVQIDGATLSIPGWFHRWEDFSSGGESFILGIVEGETGVVARFRPEQIQFTDRGVVSNGNP